MSETIDLSILETLDFDDDGFMSDASAWTPEIGTAIAAALELELTDAHWNVINFARRRPHPPQDHQDRWRTYKRTLQPVPRRPCKDRSSDRRPAQTHRLHLVSNQGENNDYP